MDDHETRADDRDRYDDTDAMPANGSPVDAGDNEEANGTHRSIDPEDTPGRQSSPVGEADDTGDYDPDAKGDEGHERDDRDDGEGPNDDAARPEFDDDKRDDDHMRNGAVDLTHDDDADTARNGDANGAADVDEDNAYDRNGRPGTPPRGRSDIDERESRDDGATRQPYGRDPSHMDDGRRNDRRDGGWRGDRGGFSSSGARGSFGGGEGIDRDRRRDRRDETRSLHCRGYNVETTSDSILRAEFEKFGTVNDVYLPKDYHTGRPRGFAYIQFEDERDAEKARAKLDRTDILGDGRECAVMWASGRRKTPTDMRRIDVERDNPYARRSMDALSRSGGGSPRSHRKWSPPGRGRYDGPTGRGPYDDPRSSRYPPMGGRSPPPRSFGRPSSEFGRYGRGDAERRGRDYDAPRYHRDFGRGGHRYSRPGRDSEDGYGSRPFSRGRSVSPEARRVGGEDPHYSRGHGRTTSPAYGRDDREPYGMARRGDYGDNRGSRGRSARPGALRDQSPSFRTGARSSDDLYGTRRADDVDDYRKSTRNDDRYSGRDIADGVGYYGRTGGGGGSPVGAKRSAREMDRSYSRSPPRVRRKYDSPSSPGRTMGGASPPSRRMSTGDLRDSDPRSSAYGSGPFRSAPAPKLRSVAQTSPSDTTPTTPIRDHPLQ